MGTYNIPEDIHAGDLGQVHWGVTVAEAINDLDERAATVETGGAYVITSGPQTVGGVKTFSSAPVVPDASFGFPKVSGLQTTLDSKVDTLSLVVPRGAVDHSTAIQDAVTRATESGVSRVTIPQLDPADATAPWMLSETVFLPSGIEVDASSARIHTTTMTPAFEIPDGEHDVTLSIMHCEYHPSRPTSAEQAAYLSTFVGVQSYGDRVTVRGHFEKFRAAVRSVRPTGVSTLAESNVIDVTIQDTDFGIVFNGHRGSRFTVRGVYSPCSGSTDPAHAIYGTQNATAVGDGNTVNASAWNSTGGEMVKIREHGSITSDYIIGTNVPALLWIENPYAQQNYGVVAGYALTGLGLVGNHLEAVRSTVTGTVAPGKMKRIQSLVVDLGPDIDFNDGRVMSTTDGYWELPSVRITCQIATSSGSQALLHFAGDKCTVGPVTITNAGAGGIIGIRFLNGTGHRLTAPPSITGMYDGVYVYTDVTGLTGVVDRSLITASNQRVNILAPAAGIAITGAPRTFQDRWYPSVAHGTVVNATPTPGTLYAHRWEHDQPFTFDRVGVQVVTAVSGATLQLAVYADHGHDGPYNRFWLTPTALSLAATGNVLATAFTSVTIPAGLWWLAWVVRSASGSPVLTGAPRGAVAVHSEVGNPSAAFIGALIARGAASDPPNNPFHGATPAASNPSSTTDADVPRFIFHTL